MTDEEKTWWVEQQMTKLPERTHIFVTPLSDIEHTFCKPEHIAAVYGMTETEVSELVQKVISDNNARLIVEFTHKRSDLKNSALRKMPNVSSTDNLIGQEIQFYQVKGKSLVPLVLEALKAVGHNPMHLTSKPSAALQEDKLKTFIEKSVGDVKPV